jgi:single-stranded DNA-binding protein
MQAKFRIDVPAVYEKWRGIGDRLKKGCLVSIQGRLEQDKWKQDGKKHSSLRIDVERIGLLGKPECTRPEDLPGPAPSENFEIPEAGQGNE